MFGRITFENSRKRLDDEQDEGYDEYIYIYTNKWVSVCWWYDADSEVDKNVGKGVHGKKKVMGSERRSKKGFWELRSSNGLLKH